ncbi:MAG: preprotein translocase subunit SecE [Actinomycetota bacterium]
MNRETKRMMAKQGADKPSRPERRPAAPVTKKERASPGEYFREVRGELKKVAWPTKPEVINSTIIVVIVLVIMTALIFGLDWVSAEFVLNLFGS